MSEKKDRFNHRRWNRRQRNWGVPSDYKYYNTWDGTRWIRARNKQLIREGKYEQFEVHRRDSGWHYW